MKKKHINLLVLSAAVCFTSLTVASCTSQQGNVETPVEEVLEFEKTVYEISSGEAVTVKGNVEGVVYSFQGGTPEGVTLDSATGVITFDETLDNLPEKKYIATKGDKQAITTIKFKTVEAKPVVTFINVSDYVLNGDTISAKSVTDSGKEYSVSYALKEDVNGISIDATTGKVSFSENVKDGTTFTIVATSSGVTVEHTFFAMTENIIYSETESQIVEANSTEEAKFVLNFNGNEEGDAATTSENLQIAINDSILTDRSGFTYDATTKTITLKSSLLNTLGTGDINVKALTQRNAVSLNLTIADKFIYTANDFKTIFEPNYSTETPSFKEGSLSGYYVLGADVDLTDYLAQGGLGYNDGKGWLPIGAYSDGVYDIPFTGTFNGNGHTISGFYINNSSLFVGGLFGRNSGTIKDLKLEGRIDAIGSWSSALVGNNSDMGTIENVIVDVNMPNEGQSATGTIASTNWGLIRNAFSINTEVVGYNETAQAWAKAGIAVGLNETTGVLENIYAISQDLNEDNTFKYGLFGYSNNAEVTSESAGKLFSSVDEMKAFDFSKVIDSDSFVFADNELPKLKTKFVPLSAGYIEFVDVPEFVFIGSTIDLNVKILPEIYQSLEDEVVYTISGIEGATLNGSTIDLSNAVVSDEGSKLTVEASLVAGNKTLKASSIINVYKELNNIEIANTETSIDEGSSLKLTSSLTPAIEDATITYKVDAPAAWMTNTYIKVDGDVVTIDENIPAGLEYITVTATAYGKTSEAKTFAVRQFNALQPNNILHFASDDSDYKITLTDRVTSVDNIELDGQKLESDNYSLTGNVLTISSDVINSVKDTMRNVKIYTNDGIYKVYVSSLTRENYSREYVTANEDSVIEIASVEDFKKYFAIDGHSSDELKANMSKTYMITADLDFEGQNIVPIGTVLTEEGAIGAETDQINFTGKIYGLGHTISNFEVTNPIAGVFGGLFRQIEGGVYDLTLEAANVTSANSLFTGALAGIFGGSATIENVNVFNSVVTNSSEAIPGNEAGTNIGGLAGKSWIDAKYCTFNGFNIDLYVK